MFGRAVAGDGGQSGRPASSRDGRVASPLRGRVTRGRQFRGDERVAGDLLQIRVGEEVVDGRRREGLGRVEHGDRLVQREQLGRRQLVVGGWRGHEGGGAGARASTASVIGLVRISSPFVENHRG